MSKKSKNAEVWSQAKKKFRLSDAHIQMARELGMNPKKLASLVNHKQEPWKAPLPDFIDSLHEKRSRKSAPLIEFLPFDSKLSHCAQAKN